MSSEPEIGLDQVICVTKDIVNDALASGTLYDWTKGLLRVEVAKRLDVDVSVILSSNEFKNAIKEANEQAQYEYQDAHPSSEFPLPEDETEITSVKKGKKVDIPMPKPKKRKPESQAGPSISDSPPSKRKKTNQPKSKSHRSASIVPSSDGEASERVPSPSKTKAPVSKTPKSTGVVEVKKISKKAKLDSDTELEDLIDEEPVKKKAKVRHTPQMSLPMPVDNSAISLEKAREDATVKQRVRTKKEPEEEDKDDKEIKRLKGLITASGFRKQYNKLFASLPDPSDKRSQIKILKNVLTKECGFPSEGKRWTLKLAKELKEKRDFEKELEDVQAFEKAVTSRSARASRSTAQGGSSVTEAMDEDDDDEVELHPKKPVNTARKSIMDFLGDQSDSE
ncbi:hypothetical protein QCA50_010586 [Cerrena zonata]|uniref:Uncharacterized protein n=1 Tax=Cerrena zonata TaxID=2478898 RepID=A0AAW0G1U6_9APHY